MYKEKKHRPGSYLSSGALCNTDRALPAEKREIAVYQTILSDGVIAPAEKPREKFVSQSLIISLVRCGERDVISVRWAEDCSS